jgi:hypothetical protein
MKTITLLLPDPTYRAISDRARSFRPAADETSYLTSFVIEQIDKENAAISTKNVIAHDVLRPPAQTTNNDGALPDTVFQILAICEYVWKYNFEYGEAVHKVAKSLNVDETTVRDKCTRRISFPNEKVNTEMFLDMLSKREPLLEYLCRRFPKCDAEIVRRFGKIIR